MNERIPCSIDQFLSAIRRRTGDSIPLLIFDQFEELFTLFGARQQDDNSLTQLAQNQILNTIFEIANDQALQAKILVIIREDFLGKLEIFSKRYPQIFDNYIRLSHLDKEAAKKAIIGPFENPHPFSCRLTATLADTIIRELSADDLHDQVHATQLQIVCDQLWQEYALKHMEITNTEFDEAGGVKGILQNYFASELDKLGPWHKSQAIQVLGNLITDSDTRDIVSQDKLNGILGSQNKQQLDFLGRTLKLLEEVRIINRTQQRENFYYEIASEYLIGPINKEKQRILVDKKWQQKRNWWLKRMVGAVLILSIVIMPKVYFTWEESRPWGYLNNLATGGVYSLIGNFASIGRPLEGRFSNTIDLKPILVSRVHLWLLARSRIDQNSWFPNISRDIVAIDMRTLNGTTINARTLQYDNVSNLEDGDIIVLAGIVPFRFSQKRIVDVPQPSGWGLLIDGKSKTAYYLSEDRHVVSLDGQDKIIVGTNQRPNSFLTIAHKNGQVTIRAKKHNHNLWTTMRLGDRTNVRCQIPPERDFAFFNVNELYRDKSCEILTGRKDLNDVTRIEHDLFTVTYSYDDASFQIVPIVSDLEASTATR